MVQVKTVSSQPAGAPAKRRGLSRLWFAGLHSIAGLRAGWSEPAFRQEFIVASALFPAAFWLGRSWLEVLILIGVLIHLMVVELLNTAIESAIDRVGPEWHDLSKRAKDLGSAAVLLSLIFAAGVWGTSMWRLVSARWT